MKSHAREGLATEMVGEADTVIETVEGEEGSATETAAEVASVDQEVIAIRSDAAKVEVQVVMARVCSAVDPATHSMRWGWARVSREAEVDGVVATATGVAVDMEEEVEDTEEEVETETEAGAEDTNLVQCEEFREEKRN